MRKRSSRFETPTSAVGEGTAAASWPLRCRCEPVHVAHTASAQGRLDADNNHFRRNRCSQRRRSGLQLTQLPSESVLAIPDRLAPQPEPLHRIWLRRSLQSSCHNHRISGTSASAVPRPTGVCCARGSAIRQLSRVTSSPMHAADGPHSIGAQQQRAGAHSGDDRA